MKNKPNKPSPSQVQEVALDNLLNDLRALIDRTKSVVSATVNAGLTILYWHVGERINAEILGGERGEYGAKIVSTLSR